MTLSEIVAWYGAVVATAGLFVTIWNARRDRPQLVVRLRHGWRFTENDLYPTDQTYTIITISNRGRRPTAIGKVWFTQLGSDYKLAVADSFKAGTIELPEGRGKDYVMRDGTFDPATLVTVNVADGTEQMWAGNARSDSTIKLKVCQR